MATGRTKVQLRQRNRCVPSARICSSSVIVIPFCAKGYRRRVKRTLNQARSVRGRRTVTVVPPAGSRLPRQREWQVRWGLSCFGASSAVLIRWTSIGGNVRGIRPIVADQPAVAVGRNYANSFRACLPKPRQTLLAGDQAVHRPV